MTDAIKLTTRRLGFMAALTLLLLACVQAVSLGGIWHGSITVQEYLAVWTPLLTLSVGYWFGSRSGQ